MPNRFQDHCVGQVSARYRRLEKGRIQVVNRCLEEDGGFDEARGVARVADKNTNAKLEVSFISLFGWRLFWGDYWILDLDEQYQYAVIGEPSRRYGWILARDTRLSAETRECIDRVLASAGYDPEAFDETRH